MTSPSPTSRWRGSPSGATRRSRSRSGRPARLSPRSESARARLCADDAHDDPAEPVAGGGIDDRHRVELAERVVAVAAGLLAGERLPTGSIDQRRELAE